MKIGWLGATLLVAAVLVAAPALAFADDATKAVDKESTGIFTSILRILIRWIFPLGAAYWIATSDPKDNAMLAARTARHREQGAPDAVRAALQELSLRMPRGAEGRHE